MAAFGLAACGDDSSSSAPVDDSGSYKSLDAAPECTDDLDGEAIFIGSKNIKYICDAEEGVWVKKVAASSSSAKAKSSSSSAKAKSSSSSAKAKSSSSEEAEVPEFYKTIEDLPKCNDKSEGDTLLVGKSKDTAVEYICKNNQWAKDDIEETVLSEGSMPNGLVIIGNQVWAGQNVNDASKGGACYKNDDELCATFGRLYTWAEAMALDTSYNHISAGTKTTKKNYQGICPDGFHIPTGTDWSNLSSYVNSLAVADSIREKNDFWNQEDVSGVLLRGTTYDGNDEAIWTSKSGTITAIDHFGFMAVGAGRGELIYEWNYDLEIYEPKYSNWDYNLTSAIFWTNQEEDGGEDEWAYEVFMDYDAYGTAIDRAQFKSIAKSVRCIMNMSAQDYMKTDEYKKMLEEAKKAKK